MSPPAPRRPGLSIAEAWDEANAFLRGELSLIAPVALAFIALPMVIAKLFAPSAADTPADAGLIILLGFGSATLQLFGWMAITILALKPGLSVAEALRAALRRMPSLLGLAGIVFGTMILLSLPIAAYLPTPGRSVPPAVPPTVSLYMIVLAVGLMAVMIRLALAHAAVAAEAARPIAAIRRSLALTRGTSWRLCGFLVMFFLFWLVVQLATDAGIGSLLIMAGRLAGQVEAARVLAVLVSAVVGAALTVWLAVILARCYARLSGWTSSGI